MTPQLDAARQQWGPFQTRIDRIEQRLTSQLRPAQYQATRDADTARFGTRHRATRTANDAADAVRDAEADIDTIRAEGRPIRDELDRLETTARRLRQLAEPVNYRIDFDAQLLARIEPLIDAVDTWTRWNRGASVEPGPLVEAATILAREARRAPGSSLEPGVTTRRHYQQLTDPLTTWLQQHHIQQAQRLVEHDTGHGIEL